MSYARFGESSDVYVHAALPVPSGLTDKRLEEGAVEVLSARALGVDESQLQSGYTHWVDVVGTIAGNSKQNEKELLCSLVVGDYARISKDLGLTGGMSKSDIGSAVEEVADALAGCVNREEMEIKYRSILNGNNR